LCLIQSDCAVHGEATVLELYDRHATLDLAHRGHAQRAGDGEKIVVETR
jgi:hypothetical protein